MSYLVYNDGQGKKEIKLDCGSRIGIGRSKVNDICLTGQGKISRRHCEIYYYNERGRFAVRDRGSTNGTRLNGNRINNDVVLSDEDEIQIGNARIIFFEETNVQATKKIMKLDSPSFSTTKTDSIEISLTKTLETLPEHQPLNNSNSGELSSGQKVKEYEILRKLGRTERSSVYLAWKEGSENAVALKMFMKDFVKDDFARGNFIKTFNEASEVKHLSFVRYIDGGAFNGHCFYVMDYMPNVSLKARIMKSAPMSELDALDIIIVIGSALNYALDKYKITHRNLKPSNILFDSSDEIVIGDYGFANWASEYIADGVSAASPWYISPEQIFGKNIDWRTDLYSLGVIFFQMLTGVLPFHAVDEEEILSMHIKEPFPIPEDRNPNINVSEESLEILKLMTAKDPGNRFHSWSNFLKAAQSSYEEIEAAADRRKPFMPGKSTPPPTPGGSHLKITRQRLTDL